MDKKQKSMLVSILAILLLIVFLIGYTFAKYYTSYNGTAALSVAKWSFKVNEWSSYETNTISLTDIANEVDLEDGKIAPGFVGQAELDLDASDSEVDVEYHVQATESGTKPDNMKFQAVIDGENTDTYESLADLADNELTGTILRTSANKTKTIIIKAIWPYETGSTNEEIASADTLDTADGEEAADYTFTLKVVGAQAKSTT